MKNRIFAILITLILFSGMLPSTMALAEEPQKTDEYEMLSAVGIIRFSDLKTNEGITYKDFLVLISNALGNNYDSYSERVFNDLNSRGIAVKDGVDYSSLLLYQDALEIAKQAMGSNSIYTKEQADGIIDWSAMTKNISNKNSKYISCENAFKLIYNMVTMGSYVIDGFEKNGGIKLKFDKEKTLLSLYRDIYKIDGIVTETRRSGMYLPGTLSGNDIKIDGQFYHSDSDRCNFFGINVTAFAKKLHNDDGIVIYMKAKDNKNNFLTVAAEDLINWNSSRTNLSYYLNGKQKQAKVEKTAKFIYNDVILSQFTDNFLIPKDGKIELIDNNDDKKYDIVKIHAYEYMVVDYASRVSKIIANKYTYDGATDRVKLELNDIPIDITIIKYGAETELKNISPWDIVTVRRSLDGRVVQVEASSTQVTGIADEVLLDDREIKLNGKVYKVADTFIKALEKGDRIARKPNCTDEMTYYISADGKIVFVDSNLLESMAYGYMTKITYSDDNDTVRIRVFDQNGIWNNYFLADKVRFNNEFKEKEKVFESLCQNGVINRQLLCYTLNKDGEVKKIVTATQTDEKDYDGFSKTSQMTYKWRINGHCFDSQVFLKSQPIIFSIPENQDGANEASYYLASMGNFSTDGEYTFEAYNVDEFGLTDMLVMTMDLKADVFAVVEKVTMGLNSDDEPVMMISGKIGDYANFTIPVAPELTEITDYYNSESTQGINTIKKGDILLLAVRGDGSVAAIKRLYSLSDGRKMHQTNENLLSITNFSNFTTSNSFDVANKYTAASVKEIDSDESIVLLNYVYSFGSRTQGIKVSKTSTNFTVFDNETGKAKVGGFDDIDPGDYVFIRVHASMGKDVIIIKNL